MSETNGDELVPTFREEVDLNELIGLYDVPAFARRGQDMEHALRALHERCRRRRDELLDMARVRLRQWAAAAVGPDDWSDVLRSPISALWPLAGLDAPRWAETPASTRRRRAIVRDLVASVERFNARWRKALDEFNPAPVNGMIDGYNEYYLLEKECALGSARLARHGHRPIDPITAESLLADYPPLPVPEPR